MVNGADKIMFTAGRESYTRPVNTGYTAYPAAQIGPNYAQYDGGPKPNYAKYDTYQSPVTNAKFDMMM